MPKQAKALLKHHQLTENDLVIINIGGNELINAVNISDINESKATINNAINIQKATIINLINNNARKIIVANAPDISKTPSFLNSYNMDKAKNLSEYFNSVWLEGMKQLQTKYPQIIKLFDLNVVFNKNLDEFQKKVELLIRVLLMLITVVFYLVWMLNLSLMKIVIFIILMIIFSLILFIQQVGFMNN